MINTGKKTNAISNSTVSQRGNGGSSAGQRTAVGSSSRPGQKGSFPIQSSNPESSQRIRPKNSTDGTRYKG